MGQHAANRFREYRARISHKKRITRALAQSTRIASIRSNRLRRNTRAIDVDYLYLWAFRQSWLKRRRMFTAQKDRDLGRKPPKRFVSGIDFYDFVIILLV